MFVRRYIDLTVEVFANRARHCDPSHSDRKITATLKVALALVDVRVLDHIVVGDGEVVPFAERGFL